MTDIVEAPAEWVAGIYQLETNDPVMGGADGIDNLQAKQLAKRTAYLKAQVEAAQGGLTAHEAAADPHPVYLTSAEGDAKVAAAVAALVASSPAALDTLNELALALGSDPNFAATITAALAAKVGLTGNQSIAGKKTFSDTTDAASSTDAGTMVSGGLGVAKKMIAGVSMEAPYARSIGGNTSALNNTFTTLFTAAVGTYLIYMRLGGAGTLYLAEGIACFDTAAGTMLHTANNANAALQISGMDVQGKQVSGGTATINWVALKIL